MSQWLATDIKPAFNNALVIVNVFGYAQIDVLMWRDGDFYKANDDGIFVEKYGMTHAIKSWTYFPLAENNTNYKEYCELG